jgi:lon-related putative ATP-dependent protease
LFKEYTVENINMAPVKPLAPENLYHRTNPDLFDFETTAEVDELEQIIGQPRAVQAVFVGTGVQHYGFNIFAVGSSGTGKRSLVTKFFKEKAVGEPVPDDWCYVYNFEQDYKPKAIRLPAGKGQEFQRDMAQFVDELQNTLVTAFESDEYRARRRIIEEEVQENQEKMFESLQVKAQNDGLALLRTPAGLVFAPVKDGEVMPPDEFKQLAEETRLHMERRVAELQAELQDLLQKVPGLQREMRRRIRDLDREIVSVAVGSLLRDLRETYSGFPQILTHLDAIHKDVIENASRFIQPEEPPGEVGELSQLIPDGMRRPAPAPARRYIVNLLVDHQNSSGPPVIFVDNPTFHNLIGRIEHVVRMGALTTDFTMIKPGSLHLANGGYLILDARKALIQPYVWEALKRALETRQLQIESPGQMLGLFGTVTLEPEPIPLDIKVALLGDRALYYLLSAVDSDFRELFKIQADFAEELPRTRENQTLYGRLIATLARKAGLQPLDKFAVARVIDHSARMMNDAEKLSMKFNDVVDLLTEANFWSNQNGDHLIRASDVQKAIDARIMRSDLIRERHQEEILRGTINIATQGKTIGQINGLSIIQLGEFSYGVPSRISARVWKGKGDVINIEREVDLSGPIHSKGVLILTSFIGEQFATQEPLSMSASLVFEQSYSEVEGDSASSAELYALISALSRVPLKQNFAVTGSVDQHGFVQAIGGVNEKIEGFFDICNARGLTGDQGVLIPSANIKNLMLRDEVIEAVEAGKFHVYPIDHINQGIELLTGEPAGEADEKGEYPEESVNGKAQARLRKFAEKKSDQEEGSEEGAG